MADLVSLPVQPPDLPWPTEDWPTGTPDADPTALIDALFDGDADEAMGHTHALLVIQNGRLVAERYGTWLVNELDALAGKQPSPVTVGDVHLSWSMAKSVLQAVVGVLVGQGRVEIDQPAPVAAWSDLADPRRSITWEQLLHMRPGLQWLEQYDGFDPDAAPDVVEMLYGRGRHDMARFAAEFPLVAEPGSAEAYTYSSGTSNIVSAAAQEVIGGGEDGMRAFLRDELFGPLGMTSAQPSFDDAGTFVASSYLHATARDYARLGLLYLRDGLWEGRRLLPEGWVDRAREPHSPDEDVFYGAHWWSRGDDDGTFYASGFESQRIWCVPTSDVIVVRLGRTPAGDRATRLDEHIARLAATVSG